MIKIAILIHLCCFAAIFIAWIRAITFGWSYNKEFLKVALEVYVMTLVCAVLACGIGYFAAVINI